MKKYQIMILKNARLCNNTTRSRPGRGQVFEAEVEAEVKASRPRPRPKFWPRGHLGLEDLTSLVLNVKKIAICEAKRIEQ